MPILAREPDVYPEGLLDRPEVGCESTRRWHVVHTRPRQEKTLARQLRSLRIAHYLPQTERKFRSPNGRRRVSFVPLFTGYLFLYGDGHERLQAYQTHSAAQVLDVPDGAELTFDLRQISRLTIIGQPLTPVARLQPGTRVRITGGPFESFEGRILKKRAGDRLLVVVNYLQQGVTVELDDYELEEL